MGVSNGWIQELPRAFVDPRRPVVAAASAEMREEGVLPYVPELPIPPDAIINYNQTVRSLSPAQSLRRLFHPSKKNPL